jgi:hypothetical protein
VLALSDRIAGVARDQRPRGSLSITVQRTDGRWLRSRPAIRSGRQRSRLPMLSSRRSSATARVMRCSRCRMRV